MAKAKTSPRQNAGRNRGTHVTKASNLSNKGPKSGTPFYKAGKTPVLLKKPVSQVTLMKKHK
jgi:hypothetical protein